MCTKIWAKMEKCGAVLVRAPPFSGKTSLARLFCMHLIETAKLPPEVLVVEFSLGLGSKLVRDTKVLESLAEHWKFRAFDARKSYGNRNVEMRLIPVSRGMEECCKVGPAVVVVDEAQMAYGLFEEFPFWQWVKLSLGPRQSRNVHFLILGAYGSSRPDTELGTPVVFPVSFDLRDLRLERSECTDAFALLAHVPEARNIIPLSPGAFEVYCIHV